MTNNYYQKHKETLQKERNHCERNKIFSEEPKEKLCKYRRNYYITHNM